MLARGTWLDENYRNWQPEGVCSGFSSCVRSLNYNQVVCYMYTSQKIPRPVWPPDV